MRNGREGVDWFKRSIDIVALLILAVGFYFIYDQISRIDSSVKESQKSADLATWNSVYQQWLILDKLFVDNPDIRPYIYSRKDISEDDPNYGKVQSYALYVINLIEYAEGSRISEDSAYSARRETLEQYFFQIFANSPIVCRVLFTSDQSLYARTKHLAHHSCSVHAK